MPEKTLIPRAICLLLLLLSFFSCDTAQNSEDQNGESRKVKGREPVGVVTYNICWECMTNNDDGAFTEGSAAGLGRACVPEFPGSRVTTCARNIANLFEDMFQKSGNHNSPPSLIALQEATRWEVLRTQAPKSLGRMAYSQHRSGNAYLTTFYDEKIWTPEIQFWGEFEKGRPFQIIVFQEGVIFVNLHLGHHKDAAYVGKKLSEGLLMTVPSVEKIANYRIILAGDFNDHSQPPRLTRIVPFAEAGIFTEVTTGETFNTCCDSGATPGKWTGSKSGDYILDSEPGVLLTVPPVYDYSRFYSDHLPVLGYLKPLLNHSSCR